jgi:hypothetical protein
MVTARVREHFQQKTALERQVSHAITSPKANGDTNISLDTFTTIPLIVSWDKTFV